MLPGHPVTGLVSVACTKGADTIAVSSFIPDFKRQKSIEKPSFISLGVSVGNVAGKSLLRPIGRITLHIASVEQSHVVIALLLRTRAEEKRGAKADNE